MHTHGSPTWGIIMGSMWVVWLQRRYICINTSNICRIFLRTYGSGVVSEIALIMDIVLAVLTFALIMDIVLAVLTFALIMDIVLAVLTFVFWWCVYFQYTIYIFNILYIYYSFHNCTSFNRYRLTFPDLLALPEWPRQSEIVYYNKDSSNNMCTRFGKIQYVMWMLFLWKVRASKSIFAAWKL